MTAAAPPRTTTVTLAVTGKELVAEGVATLTLARPDGGRLPDWTPGSHIDLVLPNGLTRQYSLCGDRWDAHSYRVGVLLETESRGGSSHVHEQLQPGHLVGVGGPRNNFPLVPSQRYVFVAGGIGITPLLPMVQQADLLGAEWQLLYLGRSRRSMAFLDELAPYGDRVVVHAKDALGPLDLAGFLGEPAEGARIYCCGPSRLLAAMETACAGLPPYTLRTERFVAEEQGAPARTAPFEVELARTGATVTVTPDMSVLEAIGSAGVEVLSSCRQGICGTCETGVLAGRPDHRDSLLDDDERAAGDCMYVCVSRALTDRLVLDL
jgi:ferredoxin-NADP reductase